MNNYIGHPSQLCGVEEHRLVGGKGDGIRIYEVRNKNGLELSICPDRNGDITRLRFKGINMSYMSPCGYVAPAYYNDNGIKWLNSFTAGFLTTCGLNGVGTPCIDEGEEVPLHGSIGNQPCEYSYYSEDDESFHIYCFTRDEVIFGRKMTLKREIIVSKDENSFEIVDRITNTGDQKQPFEILYHMNMGYPLLDEDSEVLIPSIRVIPRDEHAAKDIAHWMIMEKPQDNYRERCYYHVFESEKGFATIYQPKNKCRLSISFNSKELDGFVEWKMMGKRDYVLGLECGNCYPDGRDVMRKNGMLKFLNPGEKITYRVKVLLEQGD
ncbi:MAG: aldose 1-epimerase family protein [Lachnospiraceae bacterium]|nr:aldose 1-epimerase family protein [Lachnospiraceae bacterium]